jgi:DNA-binding IclR family transcriptional regulator
MHATEKVDEIAGRLGMPRSKSLARLAQHMDMSASSAQNLMQMLHRHPYDNCLQILSLLTGNFMEYVLK